MEDPATFVTSSIWASVNSWFTSTVCFVLLNLMIATIVFTSNLPDNNQQQQEDQKNNPKFDRNQPPIARSPSILHRLKSFNLYPQKSHHESSPETHYHQHPLEVAATQYVFNQPLDYQHFDFDSTNSDLINAASASAVVNRFSVDSPTDGYDSTNSDLIKAASASFSAAVDENRFAVETPTDGYDSDDIRTGGENADEFESLDEVYSKLKTDGHDRTKSDGSGSVPAKAPEKMKKSASLNVGFTHLEEEIVEARRPATVKERRSAVRVVDDDDDVEVDSRADDFINKFKNDLKLQRIESIIRTNRGTGK